MGIETREIARVVRERLHHDVVNIDIRADTWFINDNSFPPWYPFANDDGPHSLGRIRSRNTKRTVRCGASVTNPVFAVRADQSCLRDNGPILQVLDSNSETKLQCGFPGLSGGALANETFSFVSTVTNNQTGASCSVSWSESLNVQGKTYYSFAPPTRPRPKRPL